MLIFYNEPCGSPDCDCYIDEVVETDGHWYICECLQCGNQYDISKSMIEEQGVIFIKRNIDFIKGLF